jgi:hypothetical protein
MDKNTIMDRYYDLCGDIRDLTHSEFGSLENKLNAIKDTLNKIFLPEGTNTKWVRTSGAACKKVILTENTDKQFFGLNVYPIFDINAMQSIVLNPTENDYLINEYYVEIDSKLLEIEPALVAFCIVYDISNLTLDTVPIKTTRNIINEYLVAHRQIIKPSEYMANREVFAFGIRDCLQKITSIFNISDEEVGNNQFINDLGLSERAYYVRNLMKQKGLISFNQYESPIVVLAWVLDLYNHIKENKTAARKELLDIRNLVSSYIRRKEIDNLIHVLNRVDSMMFNEGFLGNALNSFKISGLKGYENDYYELKFEANNVEDDDQALLLIARINSRMSVIADYLSTEENISATQRIRWTKLLNEYNALRNQLASEKLRRNKTRLYVNYGFDD